MYRAIQLAKNGLGLTYPNPMVGCVIEKNGLILSEGWYKKGELHAVKNAINNIKKKIFLKKSTIYLTLEPCINRIKKISCVDLIIKNYISTVVIGITNPNPKIKGLGIKKLKNNGIKVIENILIDECRFLNKRLFTFYEKKRPFIILKIEQSEDGYIDFFLKKKINFIQNLYYQQLNNKWRSEENSVFIRKKNFFNKKKNIKNWEGNIPIKIFLDKNLSRYPTFLSKRTKTIIFKNKKKIKFFQILFKKNLINNILYFLYKMNIVSVLIEIGGDKIILEKFIKKNIWDESRIFIYKNIFLKKGLKIPVINGKVIKKININKDQLIIKKPF